MLLRANERAGGAQAAGGAVQPEALHGESRPLPAQHDRPLARPRLAEEPQAVGRKPDDAASARRLAERDRQLPAARHAALDVLGRGRAELAEQWRERQIVELEAAREHAAGLESAGRLRAQPPRRERHLALERLTPQPDLGLSAAERYAGGAQLIHLRERARRGDSVLGRCVHRRAARAAQAQRGRHAGDGAKGHRAERGVTPARPGPFPHPRGLDRHARRPGARADQRDLPPVDGERGGDALDGELIPADARRPDGALPARVGAGRGRHAERGLDGLDGATAGHEVRDLGSPLDRRGLAATGQLRRDARPSAQRSEAHGSADLLEIDVERPARGERASRGDAAVERRGEASPGGSSSGQVDAAIADQAFGDRRPGTEGRQRSGQHHFTQIERHGGAAGRDRHHLETAPQPSGAEAGLDVIHAELVIAPLTLDGDVLSRDRGEA